MEMWDQVIFKAEQLKKIESENEEIKRNLEEKERVYQDRLKKLNEEREEFYRKYPINSLDELMRSEKEREEKERRIKEKEAYLLRKNQEIDKREKEFFEKTKQIQQMLKVLNTNIKESNLPKEIQRNLLELSVSETSRIDEFKQRTDETYCSENLLDALLTQPAGDANVLKERFFYQNNRPETQISEQSLYGNKKSLGRDALQDLDEDSDILRELVQRKQKLMKDLNMESDRKYPLSENLSNMM